MASEIRTASRSTYRLHRSLGYQLSLAARIQEKRLDEWLKALGLTRITWCVLLAVGVEELKHPSDIAEFVGIDRTAMSRALRQMEGAGMIARRAGAGDRRMTTVELTAFGHSLLDRGTPMAMQNNALMEANLDAEEARELRRLLAKLHAGQIVALDKF